MLTATLLRDLLDYDPDTGVFTWIRPTTNRVKKGEVAGSLTPDGRVTIMIGGVNYRAHRLAWLYMTGDWPADSIQVDHANEDPTDNKWVNLRLATDAENKQNVSKAKTHNTCGLLGASYHKATGRWTAQIRSNGRKQHLGYFASAEDAHEAYLGAKRLLHPFWEEDKS